MSMRLEYDRFALLAGLLAIIATYLAIDAPPNDLMRASLDPIPNQSTELTQLAFGHLGNGISQQPLQHQPSP